MLDLKGTSPNGTCSYRFRFSVFFSQFNDAGVLSGPIRRGLIIPLGFFVQLLKLLTGFGDTTVNSAKLVRRQLKPFLLISMHGFDAAQ